MQRHGTQPGSWRGRIGVTTLLALTIPAIGLVQERQGLVTIAPESGPELSQWDRFVNRSVGDGTLVVRSVLDDQQLSGRRHETLMQYHGGVPVYGADVTRQTDGGATVSIFGRVYSGIDVDTTPAIALDRARVMLERAANSTIVGDDPALMIWPTFDGRLALVYRATMANLVTYVMDANNGRVLRRVREIDYQSAVGTGRGVLGDSKKVSATLAGGSYRTLDGLRPARISTLDTRGGLFSLGRLYEGGPVFDSDYAVDSDNVWTQPGAVDGHVHMGWTYDYLFKTHGLQGLDNRNSGIDGVLVPGDLVENNAFFTHPPFGPNGRGGMFFGATSSGTPVTTLDVVAHELMHGVTHFAVSQRTGRSFGPGFLLERGPATISLAGRAFPCTQSTYDGLEFYCDGGGYVLVSDHTGAINEALSDVFGTAVEFAFQPAGTGPLRADYLIGEDLPEMGTVYLGRPGPIRSPQDPLSVTDAITGFGYPDHATRRIAFAVIVLPDGSLDISNLAFVGTTPVVFPQNDDGGVHLNSTILSHVYYLAVEGGTNRTSGRSVQGVGAANRAQVERVFMRAVREMFPSALTFQAAGLIIRQSAVDLHGSGSAVFRALDQALLAVGL